MVELHLILRKARQPKKKATIHLASSEKDPDLLKSPGRPGTEAENFEIVSDRRAPQRRGAGRRGGGTKGFAT